jgi:hypothetical protein
MATQITFSNDVGRVSTASNPDGSIRWHVYSRLISGRSRIFVRREVGGVVDAEPGIQLVFEGEDPEVYFEPDLGASGQFCVFYRLNDNYWWVRTDEPDVPTPQPAQTDTVTDHNIVRGVSDPERLSVGDNSPGLRSIGTDRHVQAVRMDNNPPRSEAAVVGPVVGPPGSQTFRIRWRPVPTSISSQNINIVGFNVYLRRRGTGALKKVNGPLVPFDGYDPKIYEVDVPNEPGDYFVTQVNRAGDGTSNLVESLVRRPRAVAETGGDRLPLVLDGFDVRGVGDGFGAAGPQFVVVETAPVQALPPGETFIVRGVGEGFESDVVPGFDYDPIFVNDPFLNNEADETLVVRGFNQGFGTTRIEQTGFGSVIIG